MRSAARRDAGLGGFTVLSCDNIMGNGDTARTATLGVCAMLEPGLEEWVGQNVSFPNGMVDRITPQTADADREFLATEYGLIDRWPVVAETFIQWVIEDDFPYGRPPYQDAGVLLTDDVRPYETLKLRILNAGHSTTTYMAALVGHVYIHEIMADPLLATFMQRFHDDEATPSLPPVPGIDVEDYKRVVRERFANPAVRDQVARVCLDGTSKFPKFLIPTIESQLDKGGQVKLSALALAGWCQYLLGQGRPGPRDHALGRPAPGPGPLARAGVPVGPGRLPRPFRRVRQRLASDPVFRPAFVDALTSIREVGTHRTLERWLGAIAGLMESRGSLARSNVEATAPTRSVSAQACAARSGPLFQLERREQIMQRLVREGRVDVADLAEAFDVTSETIRRDLTDLERDRLVRRVHGGAIPWRGASLVPRLEVRESSNVDEKRRIATAAAREVPESGSLIIDSGSTALHLADVLDRERDLTVITNSVPIIRSLALTDRPEVMVLGGVLERKTMAMVDETGVDMLRDLNVDVLFIGCDGMSPERGFTTPYRAEVAIKRAMMAAARRVVMMFDHSKVGNEQLFRFAAVEEVDVIITGVEIDDAIAARLEEQGPVVIRA